MLSDHIIERLNALKLQDVTVDIFVAYCVLECHKIPTLRANI